MYQRPIGPSGREDVTLFGLADMRKRAPGIVNRALVRSIERVSIASAVMGVAVAVVSVAIGSGDTGHLAIRVGVATGVGATVYLVAARLIGIDELTTLVRLRGPRDRGTSGRTESPSR